MRFVFLLIPTLALAAPVPAEDAEKAAKSFVEKAKATNGELQAMKTDALARVFPDLAFFSVRFRQWPVAVAPAEGFRSSNVLTINDKGQATLITSGMQLPKLFQKVVAKEEKATFEVARALLTLEAELLQDGFYKFKMVEESFKTNKEKGKVIVSGRMMATEGGNGEIVASATFDETGLLFATSLANSVKPGPRPRCQATLLLHPDPEVRAVCERNLLFLGKSAREYLLEQRAKASPELQREIDRVWRQIEAAQR